VIDLIVFCAFFYGLMFVLGIVLGLTGLADSYVDFMQSGIGKAFHYLIQYALFVVFYTLMEGLSKGRTLGKLVTGTHAIQEGGAPITWKNALLRSLCRIIPFEPVSGFNGYPWHDKMTETIVVRKLKS
jgi:uncharacterized RDD family membrane protein YckC